MPSLSEKLEALGVKIGASELPASQKEKVKHSYSIEKILNGHFRQTHQGEIYTVETRFPEGQAHGCAALALTASLQVLGEWAGDPRLQALDHNVGQC